MPCQLNADCLDKIFEFLEKDRATLYSCLLVNRLWCEVSVRILWRDIWRYTNTERLSKIGLTILTCLPKSSKKYLNENGISILPSTLKPPIFNYITFCKAISIDKIGKIVFQTSSTKATNLFIIKEVIKMFMNQILSLKK